MSLVKLENGLPLAPAATNADLAKALGLEPWQLNRFLYKRGICTLGPDDELSSQNAGDALFGFGLAPIPEPQALEPPFRLPLGFVALLLDMEAEILEHKLVELGFGARARSVVYFGHLPFPGDGGRILLDDEIRAIAEDAAPAINLYGLIEAARQDPSAVFWRLADAMARIAAKFERGERSKPTCAVPTIEEIDRARHAPKSKWLKRVLDIPVYALSPRELVFLVASGRRSERLLQPWADIPDWADLVEYAREWCRIKEFGQNRPPWPDEYHSRAYAEENRWKWVVRALRDNNEDLLMKVFFADDDLVRLVLAHDFPAATRLSARHASSFSPAVARELLDRVEPLLHPPFHWGEERVAEELVRSRGMELGLQYVRMSIETGDDTLAKGAAQAWSGEEDALFWAIRAHPHGRVRWILTGLSSRDLQIILPNLFPVGNTSLIPALDDPARRARFRENIVPSLLLDRSREVRRCARLADLLARLPVGVEADFNYAQYRFLAAEAEQWEAEGHGDFHSLPESDHEEAEALEAEFLQACRERSIPTDLVERALEVVTDTRRAPDVRDNVQHMLRVAIGRCDKSLYPRLAARGLETEDIELVLGILESTELPLPYLLAALDRWPGNMAIQGAVIANTKARKDPAVQRVLRENATPHMLYALARVKLGVDFSRRAFRALARMDADRALRIIETAPGGTTVTVKPDDWSAILEHPDRNIRLRAMALLKGTSALRVLRA